MSKHKQEVYVLTPQDIAVIIAGLREFQIQRSTDEGLDEWIVEVATDMDRFPLPTDEEIDSLIENLQYP